MKLHFIVYILFSFCFLTSCEKDNSIPTAKLQTVEQIKNNQNFSWFNNEYQTYKCDTNIINQIKTVFFDQELKIVIFPTSCLCGSKWTRFPQLIKVLDAANITEEYYEIYITPNESTNFKHPYSNILKINSMPDFFTIKNNSLTFSIMNNMIGNSIEKTLLQGIWSLQNQ